MSFHALYECQNRKVKCISEIVRRPDTKEILKYDSCLLSSITKTAFSERFVCRNDALLQLLKSYWSHAAAILPSELY